MRKDNDDDEDETASMHLVFLLLDTLPYLTLPFQIYTCHLTLMMMLLSAFNAS